MADISIKAGDTAPEIVRTLLDPDGSPVNLNGVQAVQIRVRLIDGATLIDDEAEVEQGPWPEDESEEPENMGVVSYALVDGLAAGGYHVEFEVTFADDTVESFPNRGYLSLAVDADIPPLEGS